LLKLTFENTGLDLCVVGSVRKCALHILDDEPDVLIIDAPPLTVDETLASIEASGYRSAVRILLLGSHRITSEAEMAGIVGVDAYAERPLSFAALAMRARALIANPPAANQMPQLPDRVLLAARKPLDVLLTRHLLTEIGIDIVHTDSAGEAYKIAASGNVAAVLVSDDIPELHPVTFSWHLRQRGLNYPWAALMHSRRRGLEYMYLIAGMRACITLPPSRSEMRMAMASLMTQSATPAQSAYTASMGSMQQ
jgi:DNA-binding response OmpR family regulator